MKFLVLSLAVVTFGVMSFFNAPAVYTAGPEQSVMAAFESPRGQAWLSGMFSIFSHPISGPDSAVSLAEEAAASSRAAVHFVRASPR